MQVLGPGEETDLIKQQAGGNQRDETDLKLHLDPPSRHDRIQAKHASIVHLSAVITKLQTAAPSLPRSTD